MNLLLMVLSMILQEKVSLAIHLLKNQVLLILIQSQVVSKKPFDAILIMRNMEETTHMM